MSENKKFLGRLPATDRAKSVPQFGKYLTESVALPAAVDYGALATASLKQMYLNDQEGDCVIAGKAHAVGVVSANDAEVSTVVATSAEIQAAYNKLKAGPGDSGCVITDVLDYMVKTGIVFGGKARKLDGYVAIDWTNKTEVMTAIYLFGGLTLGIDLPKDWYDAPDSGDWGVTNSEIVGGHDVEAFGYDDKGVWISTWGGKRRILWSAFVMKDHLTETYAKLSPDWYGKDKIAKAIGTAADVLVKDLEIFKQGGVPSVDPVPPTPVPPVPVPPVPTSGFNGSLKFVNGVLTGVGAAGDEIDPEKLRAAMQYAYETAYATHADEMKAGLDWAGLIAILLPLILQWLSKQGK